MRYWFAMLLSVGLVEFANAQDVKFLSPSQAVDKMTYPDGFRVQPFAAEPDVVQPFAFTFDDRGRVWVAENLNYQTRGSDTFGDGPQGRIIILEDTDGDGRSDKRTVFIDKLFFPTGLALGFGGVWVGSPPNLLFIPDRDGDDKPDGPARVVLDGWGRQDRHETLNSFLWGPDGWLYGCQGVFTKSNVGKPGATNNQRRRIDGGVWRYHPVKDRFEVFAWGTSNPWGLDFDDHGQAFVTACVIPHLWHMIQGARYHRQAGQHFNPHVYDDIKTIADHRHKSAHGGARFYLADSFPPKYRGRIFMCNIHEHAVLTDIVEPRGSGFVGKHGDSFLQANDLQWLGFNMEVGPDGSIYVIDWHDADICGRKIVHGETGRVFRISHGNAKPTKSFDLAKLSDAELVGLQLNANDWYVRQARRLLHERAAAGKLDASTTKALFAMLEQQATAPKKLRALWCLHVIGALNEAKLLELLGHDEHYVRAWAIQFLCEDRKVSPASVKHFEQLAKTDASPVVRLYLAAACQRLPVDARWGVVEALAARSDDEADHNMPLMVWYALEPLVTQDKLRALKIARTTKVPNLARYISRRIVSKATASTSPSPKVYPTVAPAKSVSDDGLLIWLRPDAVELTEKIAAVTQWTNRARREFHAVQTSRSHRPMLVSKLDGRAALTFDGEDDHLMIKHESRLTFAAEDNFTISVWARAESAGGWRTIVAKSRDAKPWYGLWIDSNGRWVSGATGDNLAGPSIQKGWHHVCAVQTGGENRRFYVDGALVATGKNADGTGTGDLLIGGARSVTEFYKGAISEVRIYSRALTHPEVARLAQPK